MEVFKIAGMFLFGVVAMTNSQHCVKRYVEGEWIAHGDCGNLPTISSILHDIEERAKEEEKEALLPLRCGNEPWEEAKSLNETGGVVDINIPGLGEKEVYCDMRTDSGGWIVFQRRMDGSENFYTNWTDYVNGFGVRNKEFWLGLEAIHQLTKNGKHELRIDMIERNGTHYFAKYSSFKVKSASSHYAMASFGYSGNATDSFQQYKTEEAHFTTRDNHKYGSCDSNCAETYNAGWWYQSCHSSHLNGLFGVTTSFSKGIVWKDNGNKWILMKFTEMKVRQKN